MVDKPEGYDEWKKKMAEEELKGIKERIEKAPPIGMLPNGELNIVRPFRPKPQPKVKAPSNSENEDDISDLDDYDDLL